MGSSNDTSGAGNGEVVVRFEPANLAVTVPAGTLIDEAIAQAGLRMSLPCGGQGRCGRCVVQVREGQVRRRSTMRLRPEELEEGYALACQTVVNSDASVWVPPLQERLERIAAGDLAEEMVPCKRGGMPWVSHYQLTIDPPSMADNAADFERVQREFAKQYDIRGISATLSALIGLPQALRDGEWTVTAVLEARTLPADPGTTETRVAYRLLDVLPGRVQTPTYGLAVDVGTTTVATYLADLSTGELVDGLSAYNGQIACGEDVISRIIYARQPRRRQELKDRVVSTINELLDEMLGRHHLRPEDVTVVTVAGNTTMTHLLLGIEPAYIRLEPYIGAVANVPPVAAARVGLHVHPEALVDCLPSVGAYVGGDITSGVMRSRMHDSDEVTLFIDIGTNGEMVLGNSEWLISCACSAGPAFEGAGAASGMRAIKGAVEDVWIDPETLEPTITVIGGEVPRGICGTGMISLLGELLVTGIIDKGGRIDAGAPTSRVRSGHNGREYVVVWAADTATGEHDIVLDESDIINLIRAKGAIYAGASVLCESVGLGMNDVDRVMIGGSFGRHIDVEKAIQIGLLPDLPWDRFSYLGNTSLQGAYQALTCPDTRAEVNDIAGKMTYLELSADNRFMEAFTSALFLPHTDESLFPSVSTSRTVPSEGATAP